jgi:glycerophosphoryl diester phosphodiesterase
MVSIQSHPGHGRRQATIGAARGTSPSGPEQVTEVGVQVLGHRGARLDAPENTVTAFHAAMEQGADGVELDVRAGTDGSLICLHDPDLERTTDGSGPVARLAFDELRALDAGARFERDGGFPFRGTGVRVPTLAEALDAVPAPAMVDIEVKAAHRHGHDEPGDDEMAERVAAFLESRDDTGRLLVSSFSRHLTAALVPLVAPIPVALITTTLVPLGRAVRSAQTAGCTALAAQAGSYFGPGARAAATRARLAGLTLLAWTVDDPVMAGRLADIGVSVVISDRPAALRGLPTRSL